MINKIFVAGLPFTSTDADLRAHFTAAGVIVSANIIIDKMSGRSKGFGFVEFETPEEAAKAIEMFNESEMGGRKLVVAEAKPMEKRERPSGGYNDRSRSGGGFSRGGGRGGYQGDR